MIEQEIFNALNPLLAGGLHPAIAPQGSVRPYGVYTEVVGIPENTLSDGATIQNSLIQISVWDTSYIGAKTAGESVSAAMASAFAAGTLAGIQRSRRSTYEPDTTMHGITYEFSVWYQ